MAHFAKINSDNIVEQVIVVNNNVVQDILQRDVEQLGIDFCKKLFGDETNWVQTSYNNNIRKQFAKIGDTYDKEKDKFISPQPFPSWVLDVNDDWQAPTPKPEDDKSYVWNEKDDAWEEVTSGGLE